MIFDTHAHYDDAKFDEDRDALLSSMKAKGVGTIVNIACDINSCHTTLELTQKYEHVYGALGVHPSDIACLDEAGLAWIEETAAKEEKILAIGEIGLDYYWEKNPEVRLKQQEWFRKQLAVARRIGKPVVIHSREAAADTMRILMEEPLMDNPGVVHCYAYSVEQAREYVKRGYYIGVGGVLTYSNSRVLKEVVADIDLSHIVLETDCPYLTPVPNRGKRNSSLNLPYVVQAIAEIKGLKMEEVIAVTEENAKRLYQMQ